MLSLFLASALSAAACHGGEMMPDADEALACMTSGRGDTYVVGLEHKGVSQVYDFKLMSSVPAPPARNLNTWVLQIGQVATGAPVTGASLNVSPFMPDHQHGPGAYTPQVQEMSTPGQYQISDINTWMPGYWEVTINATTPDNVQDTVVYKFCIPA
ncbi:MAG TPA: FixH family protein [Kofleriaceae bacterium]|nr:FixH family protein [Kofleriaceae bacterium]